MPSSFACYYPGEKPIFLGVEFQSDDFVSDLLDKIPVKLKARGQEVHYNDLRLFKTDIPLEPEESLKSRTLQWLHERPPNSQLSEMSLVETIFPDGPHPRKEGKLDIIVGNAEVQEMADNLGDPYDGYKRKLKKALNRCRNNCLALPSPSNVVKNPLELAALFGGEESQIHIGRPGGAPATIFNPILAALQQSLDDLERVDVSDHEVSLAAIYILHSVQFYDCEEAHEEAIEELVNKAIGGTGYWRRSTDMEPLNPIRSASPEWYYKFPVFILEFKDSLGLSGDALYQATVGYSKIVSWDLYQSFREYCNFPCVLIGVTANRLEISVAVSVGPIYVTRLLTLDLSLGFHASDNIIRLARVFKTLSHHREELEKYYESVESSPSPSLSCLFPNPTPIDPSKPLPRLTYRQFLSRAGQPTPDILDLGNTTSAMYIATLDDTNQEVIVKFTATYNEEAHRLLAQAQLAPQLHFCGRVVGDLYMIVMERVNGTSVWQLQEDNIPIPEIVLTKVEEAVGLLHGQDIVFGDLRTNNVLYVVSDSDSDSGPDVGGQAQVVLVDFDWAGKDGESRYPAALNRFIDGMTWHKEVSPYCIMRKAHDLWMLNQLKALCKSVPV